MYIYYIIYIYNIYYIYIYIYIYIFTLLHNWGFLSWTFTTHRSAGKGGGHIGHIWRIFSVIKQGASITKLNSFFEDHIITSTEMMNT